MPPLTATMKADLVRLHKAPHFKMLRSEASSLTINALYARGLLRWDNGFVQLTPTGAEVAAQLRKAERAEHEADVDEFIDRYLLPAFQDGTVNWVEITGGDSTVDGLAVSLENGLLFQIEVTRVDG